MRGVSRCKRKPDSCELLGAAATAAASGPDVNEGLDSVDGWKQEIAKGPAVRPG